MKTKHFALTALALAAAGAANAQSSVTIYGVADAFVQYLDGSDSLTRLQSGGLNGSRLGFRGTEDLGGGLKALFTIESGINIDDGTVGQGGVMWGRQAFVGLGSNLGTITAGRQYGSVYTLTSDFSAFSNGSYGPSTAVIGGFAAGNAYEPVRGAGGTGTGSSTGLGGPARVNNSVKYETPSFGGFKVGALWGFGEVGDEGDNRTADIYARYTAGPFDAMISYMDDKREATVAPAPVGAEVDAKTISIAGAYNIAGFRILAGYLQTKDDSPTGLDGEGWWLGGDYRFGAHLISAQYVANSPDTPVDRDTQAYGIGYRYDLSKRTAFYSSLTFFDNDDAVSRFNSGSAPNGVTSAGDTDITELVVGIRHAF